MFLFSAERRANISAAFSAPVINDVATSLDDPPVFTTRDIPPLPDAFKPSIRKAYGYLQPLVLQGSQNALFETARQVAESQTRWSISKADPDAGIIEGVSTTALMRFKDDFVIRMRAGSGSQAGSVVVDMRSRSRVGKGDLGANAHRIKTYLAALQEAAGASKS